MPIQRWFALVSEIGQVLCRKVDGQVPDYRRLARTFLLDARIYAHRQQHEAAALLVDAAALARDMSYGT